MFHSVRHLITEIKTYIDKYKKARSQLWSGEYVLVQVLETVDALDKERSAFDGFGVRWISKPRRIVFRAEGLGTGPLFRDKSIHPDYLFVRQEFVQFVRSSFPPEIIDNLTFVNIEDEKETQGITW